LIGFKPGHRSPSLPIGTPSLPCPDRHAARVARCRVTHPCPPVAGHCRLPPPIGQDGPLPLRGTVHGLDHPPPPKSLCHHTPFKIRLELRDVFCASKLYNLTESKLRRAQSVAFPSDPAKNNTSNGMYEEEVETTMAERVEEARERAHSSYVRMMVEELVPWVLDAMDRRGASRGSASPRPSRTWHTCSTSTPTWTWHTSSTSSISNPVQFFLSLWFYRLDFFSILALF
jgi:hypothetical protein